MLNYAVLATAIPLILSLLILISVWRIYARAGAPAWGSIVPIYNCYLWFKIGGKPGWWWLLLLIPVVNIVIAIMSSVAVAKAFGRSGAFAIGMCILSFIFLPILAFGDNHYQRPALA